MEKEVLKLIATRIPPGDSWKLIDGGGTYKSLTETLEAYFQSSQDRCDFRLSPLKGEIYVISKEKVEVEKPKKFNIYGD